MGSFSVFLSCQSCWSPVSGAVHGRVTSKPLFAVGTGGVGKEIEMARDTDTTVEPYETESQISSSSDNLTNSDEAGASAQKPAETVCFTPGTLVATPKGERQVQDLQVGDRVITRDNGIQEIRWLSRRNMLGTEMARRPHLKPVLIRRGALGNGVPERDMMVSQNHRMLVTNDKTALYFEDREVLVSAKHLTGLVGVDIVDARQITYLHFLFDQHEVILTDGTWTESFQPADRTLQGLGNAQRTEVYELFPELKSHEGLENYQAARRSLNEHEVGLLNS